MFRKILSDTIKHNLIHLPQIIFEVTDACNLRCKYCAYADLYEGYDERKNMKLPFHKARLILDYLHALWKENRVEGVIEPFTIGFYGGEPLLNVPFIKQVMEYAESIESSGKKIYYSMTTNAVLLDKYMDFLAEKEVRLLISLDGDEEGQGYRVDTTGKNLFFKVFNNIKLLQQKHPEYFERLVRFNSVLHSKNSVESTLHFIKEAFGKTPSISPLSTFGIRKDKIEEFNQTYRNYNESVQQAINCESLKNELFIMNPETGTLLNHLYFRSGNVFFNYNNLIMKRTSFAKPVTGTCTPFARKMFVTVKGRILPCERINHEFSFGQITDTSVELNLTNAAEKHNYYIFKYLKQCETCANKSNCFQCVYQIDDINDKQTICRSYCTEKQKNLEFKQSLKYLTEHPEYLDKILNNVVLR